MNTISWNCVPISLIFWLRITVSFNFSGISFSDECTPRIIRFPQMLNLRMFPKRETNFQLLHATIAGLALVGPGMGIAYPSVALPNLTSDDFDFKLSTETAALFASVPSTTMPIGCMIGILTMRNGRRFAISVGSSFFALSWIIIASSHGPVQLLAGRLIQGVATGLALTPTTVYISEVSSLNLGAILNAGTCLCVSFGYVIIYLLGFLTQGNWELSATISTVIPVLSVLGAVLIIPESPRWLLLKKRTEAARTSLLRLRGLKSGTPKFEREFAAMIAYSESDYTFKSKDLKEANSLEEPRFEEKKACFATFWEQIKFLRIIFAIPEVWKPFLILNAFFLLQEFSGVTVVVPYAVDIVSKAGVVQNPYLVSTMMGLLQMSSDITLVFCSSRIGRRKIGIISGIGTSISLATLGIYNHLFESTRATFVPLAAVLTFVIMGSIGIGNLPWAMIGELYPTKFINILGPLTTFGQGLYNFASIQIYPTLVKENFPATLYFYSAVAVVTTLFIVLVLPETRGKSKAEIEASFKT